MNYPFRNSELPIKDRVIDLVKRLTTEEKVNLLATHQLEIKRLGIGEWYVGCEVARGYVGRKEDEYSTVFPQPIGMAGTFDTEIMHKVGEISATEARIYNEQFRDGRLMLWGPTVDLTRDPRWGRNEECYGEDPFLTGQMCASFTRGLAGDDKKYLRSVPTLKHFCANSNEENRGSCNANLEPRTKHEYYYKAFEIPITKGGAHSMMTAYNEISGVPAMLNPDLQTIVKDKWGLDFVVTDGGDYCQTTIDHKYTSSHTETLALALKAGNDVMCDNPYVVRESALEALKLGLISMDDIDIAISNSLSGRFKLGEFDEADVNPYGNIDEELLNCDKYRDVNHRVALEQVVLLKNNEILPLDKNKNLKIALIGDLADNNYPDWYTGKSCYETTILEGMKNVFGNDSVTYDPCHDNIAIKSVLNKKYLSVNKEGEIKASSPEINPASTFIKADWGHNEITLKSLLSTKFYTAETGKASSESTLRWFTQEIVRPRMFEGYNLYNTYFNKELQINDESLLVSEDKSRIKEKKLFHEEIVSCGAERAAKLAAEADVTIVCVGNDPMIVARECYDRTNLNLPSHQENLIKAAVSANPNTIVIVVSSYPYTMKHIEEISPAIIYTSHAGPELGSAIAEVISGQYNPAGRLAQTWYSSVEELPSIFDYDIIKNNTTYLYYDGVPLYPFGHGLSYSDFKYSDFSVKQTESGVSVSFNVTNNSFADGDEVAQIYFRAENPSIKRPLKQLCGFERKHIKAGKTEELVINISNDSLEFYDVSREKFCLEAGEYTFMVGSSCVDIKALEKIHLTGDEIPPRDLSYETKAINYNEKSSSKMGFSKKENCHYMNNGCIIFNNVQLKNERHIEFFASTPVGLGKINLYADDTHLGEIIPPVTTGPDDFEHFSGQIPAVNGIKNLKIELGDVNLISFRLY